MQDLFFYSAKIVWMLLSPDKLFLLLLITASIALALNYLSLARGIVFFITTVILILSILPVGDMMLYPLESRFPHNPPIAERIDGIIVLGGPVLAAASSEWQQLETNSAHERLDAFIALAKRFPAASLVYSGGNGSLNRDLPAEADLVKDYLIENGISGDRLILERASRNTAENAAYSQEIVQPRSGDNWILVTTAFHMPRSVGLFCNHNWAVIPYPVDHYTVPGRRFKLNFNLMDNANNFSTAAREWAGLLAYSLSGRINDLLPRGCR